MSVRQVFDARSSFYAPLRRGAASVTECASLSNIQLYEAAVSAVRTSYRHLLHSSLSLAAARSCA
jgi:hypothetical protein